MIARAIGWSARRPGAVLAVAALAALGGEGARRALARDAVPDLSDRQVVLVAEWMGHPAVEVAASLTQVLMRALAGVDGATAIRGSSMSGMGYLDVVFQSAAALARGRADIIGRIDRVRADLPATARVRVGPEASSTGWVFQYALVSSVPMDPMHAFADPASSSGPTLVSSRRFQDEVLAPALAALPGVAEVASMGGEVEQVLVEARPERLRAAGLALSDLVAGVRAALGGAVRPGLSTLEGLPIAAPGAPPAGAGRPPRLGELARVRVAGEMANAIVDLDGRGAVVGGIVIARRDADVARLVARVKEVIAGQRARLPPGIELVVVYDRAQLAERMERTVSRALGEEIGVVVLVVLLFLSHGGSALVPALTLGLVALLTFLAMWILKVPATIMSTGGIAIALGLAVDADVVALEACHRGLEAARGPAAALGSDRRARLVAAAGSVSPAILTSLVIAALTFLPVFAFSGEAGRLLRPLALTKTLVIGAAALVALSVAPALRDRLLRGRVAAELGHPITRTLVRLYRPAVRWALDNPLFTLATAALALASCLPLAARLGGEFLPRVDEGDLLFMPTTAPGATLGQTGMQLGLQDQALRARPEVAAVFGKIGRADSATDPAPASMAETIVRLKPREEWPRRARARWYSGRAPAALTPALRWLWPEETEPTAAELIATLDGAARLPGWTGAWTAPARARLDMMSTGVRTPVGARIVADDPARLDALGAVVRALVLSLPGTRSAVYEPLGGETRLGFTPEVAALARHHVDPGLARDTAELLLAGGALGLAARDGRALPVRLASDIAPGDPAERLRAVTVRSSPSPDPRSPPSQPIPLALLGQTAYVTTPAVVRSERGRPAAYVQVDLLEGTDLGGYVERAQRALAQAMAAGLVRLAPGERVEWTGQYPLMIAGQRRLRIIVPLVVLSMFALLWWLFGSAVEALIVLASLPLALVGSVWTLWWLDYRLSAPVWVGLLSTLGLAMQTGVVMVVYIDQAFYRRVREGRLRGAEDIVEAHAEGTVLRLRPKLMTVATMAAALLPLLWSRGAGAEIMRRVAAPMLGGLASSAFLTLEVLPVLYTIWRRRQLRRAQRTGRSIAEVVGQGPTWARR
jgi:Cu(I)/Ag(I) efflux system membrane protein CusA/SilA